MKKVITLALALLMVIGVAVPALAFTTDEYEDGDGTMPYEVGIMLVDYDEGYVSKHVLSLPETNRGYLKNEVICAVASIYIPKGEKLAADKYTYIKLGGENVDVDVRDNYVGTDELLYTNILGGTIAWVPDADDDSFLKVPITAANFDNLAKNRDFTVNIAFFGKVIGDDGLAYVELNKNTEFNAYTGFVSATAFKVAFVGGSGTLTKYIIVGDYLVIKEELSNGGNVYYFLSYKDYTVDATATYEINKLLFSIQTDSKERGKVATFYQQDPTANTSNPRVTHLADYFKYDAQKRSSDGKVIFGDSTAPNNLLTPESTGEFLKVYDKLADLHDDDFVDGWGFDLDAVNNVVKESFFKNALKVDNKYADVAVEPFEYTLEVVVPDEVIVDPPKVG